MEDKADIEKYIRGCIDTSRYFRKFGFNYSIFNIFYNSDTNYISCDLMVYGPSHRQVMAARIWLNNGRIYLIDWAEANLLYDKSPDGVETFEEFKARITLPKVPAGILKIPERI